MITETEQETMDLDWFITDGTAIGFMASGGGKLPNSVAESGENRQLLAQYFRSLPERSEVTLNPELNEILMRSQGAGMDERYLEDYVLMAKKGLYSFDKTIPCHFSDPHYHLVARPELPLTLNDLPEEMINILLKTRSLKRIETSTKICIEEIE